MPVKQLRVSAEGFPTGDPDVQRTSFSLDVLGRYICNTYDEATTNPDFDVIVIGSGMYGAYCAAKLYRESDLPGRTPLRILVLEAGPFLLHEHGQNIADLGLSNPFRPDHSTPRSRYLVWGTGWLSNTYFPGTAYCVGGKSLYWGGWCPRLTASDLAQWPYDLRRYLTSPPAIATNLPNRLDAGALAPKGPKDVYEAVEYEIGVKPADDFVFDPVHGGRQAAGAIGLNEALRQRLKAALAELRTEGEPRLDTEPQDPPIAVQTQSFVSGVFSPDKFSSLTLLISALRNARRAPDATARLFLVPNAHVSKIEVPKIRKDGADVRHHRATGIHLFVEGVRKFLPIKPTCSIVLALGCIESTRLALECFPTEPDDRSKERMGRNLMAHLRFDFPFQVDRKTFAKWVKTTGKTLRDELQTASFHVQGESPDGRFHFQVYATGDSSGNPEGLLYRMIPDVEVAQRLASTQNPNVINMIIRACGEMRGDRAASVGAPNTNWIDLAGEVDGDPNFDHRRAFVHYADQSQSPIWRHMRETAEKLAKKLGALSFPPKDPHEVGSTWHDSGTLFIGDNPAESVTDTLGHFHHLANVACVDQALFPTVGSANPVLTGLCLSRRVAETIGSRSVSQPELAPADKAAEKAAGFEFMLENGNAARWQPNHARFNAHRPHLIENGTVLEVHGNSGLGALCYLDPQPFGDFELRLQWKAFLDPLAEEVTANSGIFLRAPQPPADLTDTNFYSRCIEIQIDDSGYDFARRRFGSPLHRTGAIYGLHPAMRTTQKLPSTDNSAGFWNDLHITARGKGISVELNGLLVSEGDVSAQLVKPGVIGLQYHTGKVQFRNLRVRRI